MANTESLVFDLLVKDSASRGLSDIGKAADGASRNTDALTRRLNDLSRKSVEARLRLSGDKEALASLDKMDARLISLDRRVASPNMKVEGAARAIAEISAVDLELDKLGGQGGTAQAATSSLGAGGLAGPAGMGALIAGGVALAPVIATLGLGLGGLGLAAISVAKNQQLMTRELAPLKGELHQFSASLQPEVLTVFGDGVRIAGHLLADIQPVAKATGAAFDGFLGQVDKAFASGQFQGLFDFMAKTAGPDMALLGASLTDLISLLPQLLTQLQPIATEMLQATDGTVKLVAGIENLNTASNHLSDSSQHSAGWLGILAGAAKHAAINVLPGVASAQLLQKGLSAVSSSSAGAAGGIRATAAAAVVAAPAVGTLSGDVTLLDSATTSANVGLKAFSDLWDIFVGKSVSDQQAVLNVTAAFENFDKTAQNSKKTSTQVQLAFLSIFDAMKTGLESMRKNGASVQTVNDLYATSIARLNALHGLTPAQRADVQGLTKDYLAWANSVFGLSGNTVKAAGVIRTSWLATMSLTHQLVPVAKKDADAFADSVLKTGTNSRTTKHDRDVLIADLVHSGLSAAQAKADVIQFQGQIDKLHGKTVPIAMTGSGSGTITFKEQNIKNAQTGLLEFHARGGRVGGSGTGDTVPAMLTPGEVVIPVPMVRAGMVDHLRGQLPGFAGGGLVGPFGVLSGVGQDFMGTAMHSAGESVALQAATMMIADMRAKVAAAIAAATIAGTNAGGRFIGVGQPAGSGPAAFAQVAARMGWGPAELAAWNYVEMREAGYSLTATNPSSGAYGMAQFINGAGEYAQWGGNSTTYIGQATAMANYIRSRYGDPIAAAAHEACVPLDAEILTRRGWLTYDQLQPGDETIGFDPATGRNAWTPVNQVHIYEDAPLVRLTSKTWEATCTPNHRWVAEKFIQGQADGYRHEMARAGSFGTRHRLRLAAETDTGDGPAIDDREAELLGWVLGDGSVAHIKNKTASSPSIRLYQSKPAHVAVIDELVDGLLFNRCIRQMNKPSGESGLPLVTWEFTRAYSAELLKRSGYDHKGPVPFVLSLSPRQRTAFMRGVFGAEGSLVGDGTFSGVGNAKYGSYRRTKAYPQNDGPKQDAIILGVYLSGHRPGISELDNRGTTIGRWTVSTMAAVIRETKPFIGGEKIKRADAGRGPVWCVSTGLGSWTMRQGRQVMLTGNSFNWYDQGGMLQPGLTLAYNGTGRPEQVLPPGRGGGDTYITLNVTVPVGAHPAETGRVLAGYLMEFKKRGGKY